MDKRGTNHTNGLKDKKVDDYAQSFTSERCHRQTVCVNNSIGNISMNKKKTQQKMRKMKWEEKQLYGYFKTQPGDIAHEKTWIGKTMKGRS